MRNAILPYLIIAIVGIVLAAGVSYIGIDHRDAIQNEDNNNEENNENNENDENGGDSADEAEDVFKQNCAKCHGDDLEGDSGPDLTEVGDELSEDEIDETITEGTDAGMPGGLIDGEEKEAVVEWLSDMD